MYMSGFADEAADGIEAQIRATESLGWNMIEARSVDGRNIHDLGRSEFDAVRRALDDAEIGVDCFGSTIANWGKSVDEDFGATLETVGRCVARMKELGTTRVRIMSYAIIVDAQGRALPDQRETERFEKLRGICSRFLDAGIAPLHENCFNYGGMSWEHTRTMLDAVPGLRLIFDTGNPGLTPDFRKAFPYPNQDSFESYENLKPWIDHVHVKDGVRDPVTGVETYSFPGEGACDVEKILADLIASGYDGGFSIEPHMAVVFHNTNVHSPESARYDNYIEYGKRAQSMIARLGGRPVASAGARLARSAASGRLPTFSGPNHGN